MRRAVVAGHLCVDLVPELPGAVEITPGRLTDVGPLVIRPGGCVANTGCGLAALGASVRLAADLGDDDLGRLVCQLLATSEANLSGLRTVPGATSYSVVLDPAGGDRSFWHHLGTNRHFDGSHLDLSGVDLLHLGYPTALPRLYADDGARLLDLLSQARRCAVTSSVDLSTVDPGSDAATVDWQKLLIRALPDVDIFTPSADDLVAALGVRAGTDPQAMARFALQHGAAVVLVTNGSHGMHLLTADEERLRQAGPCFAGRLDWARQDLFVPAEAVPEARTTGAGDAAAAGLLYGVLTGAGPETAVRFAAAAATDAVRGNPLSARSLQTSAPPPRRPAKGATRSRRGSFSAPA